MSIAAIPVGQAPDQILQQALMGMVPSIKPYEALTELHSRVKSKSMAAAMQGQNAIQQAQQIQQQPPIAAQVAQANEQLNGIAALPVPTTNAYNAGGIVAFSGGGSTPYGEETQEERDRRAIMEYLRGAVTPFGKLAAAGADMLTLPVRGVAGAYNSIARVPRAFGVPLPFVPKEFGTESMTPYYDRFFRRGESRTPAQVQAAASEQQTTEVPEARVVSEPQRVAETPQPAVTGSGTSASRSPTGGAGAPRASTPAWPEYNPQAPQLTIPEVQTAEEMAAETRRLMDPRMSEFDKRMQRFRDRAAAMQRGEGVKTPSRFERGLAGALAGATDEVAAARRAGIRPSLGMALASAGRAAMAGDKEREEKRQELIEKGQQLEMTLEAQRLAYERGEYETANRLGEQARRLAAERNAALNEQAKLDAAAKERSDARKFREAEIAREERQKELDRAQRAEAARLVAERQSATSNAADVRAAIQKLQRDGAYIAAIKEIEEAAALMSRNRPDSPIFANEQRRYQRNLQIAQQRAAAAGVALDNPELNAPLMQNAPTVPPDIQNILNKYR